MDFKSIALFLPIVAAILWGLAYSVYGHLLKSITVPTLMIYISAANICSALIFSALSGNKISLVAPFENSDVGFFLCVAVLSASLAWLIMINVVKFVSPTYAAIGEVAYFVFIPIFAWLIFRRNEFDVATVAGGFLIMLGLFVMIYFKSKGTSV